jgi:hypothetical protein
MAIHPNLKERCPCPLKGTKSKLPSYYILEIPSANAFIPYFITAFQLSSWWWEAVLV